MKKNAPWLVPIFVMILIAPFTPWLDLWIAGRFYEMGAGTVEHFVSHFLFDFMYVWALLPGQLLLVGSVLALFCSYFFAFAANWQKPALVLVLTYAIGAGLVSHAILKDHWGRPRPKQIEQFGGTQEFRPFWSPYFTNPIESKSFPCGHCTMGFSFFAIALLGKRYKKQWIWYAGMAFALILGCGLGVTRMAQGGHFLSDVLLSGLILWLSAWGFDRFVYD